MTDRITALREQPGIIQSSIKERIRAMNDAEFAAYITGVKDAKSASVFSRGVLASAAIRGIGMFMAEAPNIRALIAKEGGE